MYRLVKKYIIIILTFYIFWLGLLPLLLSKTVSVLCGYFSANSDYEITVEKPQIKLYLTPVVRFKVKSFSIKNKNLKDNLRTENVYIKLRILPLLSGKIHINTLKADELYFEKEIKKDTKLNKNFFENLDKMRCTLDSVELRNFNTIFISEDTQKPIVFKGKYLIFGNRNRHFDLHTDSTLISESKTSKIYADLFLPKNNDINQTKFDIKISNLDIEPIGEFFRNFLPEEIKSLYGRVDVSANKNELKADLHNLKILHKDTDYSVIFPEKTTIKSNFSINQNSINMNNTEISAKNISVQMSGKIKDYVGKATPSMDLKIIINKSNLEDFIKCTPPFRVEEFDCYKLKKYKFFGKILGNLSITGKLPEPNIFGKIFVDDGVLIKPIPNTTKGATLKLNFTGRQVNFDVNVPAGGTQRVWVKGTQELYNIKYADMVVKSTSDVNLHVAEEVVNPLHEILNFIVGPLPILDVYGTGNIDLAIKGNRTTPHARGTLNFKNAEVNFIEIPDLKLKNADAVLTFNDTTAVFRTNKGMVNDKNFSIIGTCNFDGDFDFDTVSENQPASELYKAILTSTMLEDIKKMIPNADTVTGLMDLELKIYGKVKNIEDLKFNKNAFAKGLIKLKNGNIIVQGINITNAEAEIKPEGTDTDLKFKGTVDNSPLNITAKVRNDIADISAEIPKFNPNCLIKNSTNDNPNYLPNVSVIAKYKGNVNDIEYNKLNLDSKIIPFKSDLLNFNSGQILLNNGKLGLKNIDFYIKDKDNSIKADLQVSDLFSEKPVPDGLIKLNISDIKVLNEVFGKKILPENINNILKDYEFKNGSVKLNATFNDGKLSTEYNLAGLKFIYLPLELPVEVLNGKITARNNDLKAGAVNILADNMPILLDGEIKDITGSQRFNVYVNSKPKQEFIDKYINKNTIYPLKIKGDIICKALLKGVQNDYELKSNVNMAKDASIYYYGATVGDIENSLALDLDAKVLNKNNVKVREFLYDKVINSQNGKQTNLNMLKLRGGIGILKNDVEFRDLLVKTSNPTDVRIFNIIFGKPNIKQGQFTSDLRMSGKLSSPKITGDFHIFETNIPFLDTTMKNIEFVFRDKYLEIKSKGEVLGNDVTAEALLRNKLTKPYYIEKAVILTNDMDLNRVVDKLKTAEADNDQFIDSTGNFDISSIVVNNLKVKADNVILRNIHAKDFEADSSLNENRLLEIKNFKFNIAQGHLNGKYNYNLKNNNTTLKMEAENISANDISWAIFDLQNQIYGDLTGKTELSCNGSSFESCMKTLNGSTAFNVKNGRMPKLGSLEYLLKAGNLVKGGITSLSISSVIDLISPMKTGEFSDIFGAITIKNGVADDIEIITQGKDLSLYIGGKYDFSTSVADMEVIGMLSRKISTMFGAIGNISVNTLFNLIPGVDLSKDSDVLENINKIPGIEISGKSYRKFVAKIMGNINGDNYVTSFKWIN